MPRGHLTGPVLDVAPTLLGAVVEHGGVAVRLTEVEAYDGANDPGSHAYRGRTPRTEAMFREAGHLYVYFTYGMHYCANVVTGTAGSASAVLLRGGEVVAGHEGVGPLRPRLRERDWARGPARLATTLGLAREHNGIDLIDPASPVSLWLPAQPADPARIATSARTGVSGPGGDHTAYPWRFYLEGEPSVSPYRPATPRRRRTP
ncbi:DNA-3-methyladenine glycosylase [Actinomycetota bacterium]